MNTTIEEMVQKEADEILERLQPGLPYKTRHVHRDKLENRLRLFYTHAYTLGQQDKEREVVEKLENKKQMVSQSFLERGDTEMQMRAILNHRIDDILTTLTSKDT